MNVKEKLQLLPGTKKRLGIRVPGQNRFLYLGSMIFGAALVTTLALGQYRDSLQSNIKKIDDQLVSLEQRRDKRAEQDLKLFKDRIELTSRLLSDHIYWTKAISVIVNLLQTDVRFKAFSGDASTAKINIVLQATNYTVLAKQLAAFLTEDGILDISISKKTTSSIGFLETSLEIQFDKSKIIRKIK